MPLISFALEPHHARHFSADRWSPSPWDISHELRSLAALSNYYKGSVPDSERHVAFDKHAFQVNVDVQQFAPDEITVKTSGDNSIIVEGKHEEKHDEHGSVSRHFVRRYVLPKGHDINQVVSHLSSDGVLTIKVPTADPAGGDHKVIPITQTGVPSKAVENKPSKQE